MAWHLKIDLRPDVDLGYGQHMCSMTIFTFVLKGTDNCIFCWESDLDALCLYNCQQAYIDLCIIKPHWLKCSSVTSDTPCLSSYRLYWQQNVVISLWTFSHVSSKCSDWFPRCAFLMRYHRMSHLPNSIVLQRACHMTLKAAFMLQDWSILWVV